MEINHEQHELDSVWFRFGQTDNQVRTIHRSREIGFEFGVFGSIPICSITAVVQKHNIWQLDLH